MQYTYENRVKSLRTRLMLHKHINQLTNCWEWTGSKNQGGYGMLGSMIEGGNSVYAHRASWIVNHGPIPEGHVVCHKCDNPACFNPDHLWIGSDAENTQDRVQKKRTRADRAQKLIEHIGYSSKAATEIVAALQTALILR